MRLKGRDIDHFVKAPDPGCRFILIYGPDEGLVRERCHLISQKRLGNTDDPFALLELTEDEYRSDPARLSDEYGAVSMFGGERVICVRLTSDRYGKHFKELIAAIDSDALIGEATIIVTAGDLKVSSVLRKAAETAKRGVALPCYRDDAGSLRQLIQDTFRSNHLHCTDDVLSTLIRQLGGDRAVTRQEIEKLILYKHTDTQNPSHITEDDIDAAIASANLIDVQDVTYAALTGDIAKLTKTLERCYLQNEQPVGILRATARHLEQLYSVYCGMDKGDARRTAIDKLTPRIHFQKRREFEAQISQWNKGRCQRALALVYDAETDCKTTGMPAHALCSQTLIRLARAARSSRRAA